MSGTTRADKRKHPRIRSDLSLKIKHQDADIITKGENISLSGIYCKSDKPIPLMSRIEVVLLIPQAQDRQAITIKTSGVVVREHPVIIDKKIVHYDIAIFFEGLAVRERKVITNFIQQRLAHENKQL